MSLSEPIPDEASEPSEEGPPYFVDDRHALTAGLFVGSLSKAGFTVMIYTDDEGNYTNIVEIDLPSEDGEEPLRILVKVLP